MRMVVAIEDNAERERMNRLFVGRELRMVELKKRIRALEQKENTQTQAFAKIRSSTANKPENS